MLRKRGRTSPLVLLLRLLMLLGCCCLGGGVAAAQQPPPAHERGTQGANTDTRRIDTNGLAASAPAPNASTAEPTAPDGGSRSRQQGQGCVILMRVVPGLSPLAPGSEVTRPVRVTVHPAPGRQRSWGTPATGVIPVLLYNESASACPTTTAAVLRAVARGGAGFVAAPLDIPWRQDDDSAFPAHCDYDDGDGDGISDGNDGTALPPDVAPLPNGAARWRVHGIRMAGRRVAMEGEGIPGGAIVGTANLTDFREFLYSPHPWPASLGGPDGFALSVPTNATLLRAAYSVSSWLTLVPVVVDLRGVSYLSFPSMSLAQDQVDQTLTLRLHNLTIRTSRAPFADLVDAELFVSGNITAVARIPQDMLVLPLADVAYPPVVFSLRTASPSK